MNPSFASCAYSFHSDLKRPFSGGRFLSLWSWKSSLGSNQLWMTHLGPMWLLTWMKTYVTWSWSQLFQGTLDDGCPQKTTIELMQLQVKFVNYIWKNTPHFFSLHAAVLCPLRSHSLLRDQLHLVWCQYWKESVLEDHFYLGENFKTWGLKWFYWVFILLVSARGFDILWCIKKCLKRYSTWQRDFTY